VDITQNDGRLKYSFFPADASSLRQMGTDGSTKLTTAPTERTGMSKKETAVEEIMSAPVETVAGETTVREAAQVLRGANVGSLVVGEEIIQGIVTETDVVDAVSEGLDLSETAVAEIMSDPVVTIRPHEPVHVAGERMGHNAVKKLPVTENGEPVGIVTTTDLAHFFPRNRITMASDPERDVQEGEFE